MGRRNHVSLIDGGPDPHEKAQVGGETASRCEVLRLSAVSRAKTAELIEMPFGIGLGWAQGSIAGVRTGATWRIPLNRPCAAAMRPVVELR